MHLNLKQLGTGHANNGKALDFTHTLDLSAVKLWGGQNFSKPVSIIGSVTYRFGFYTIRYTAQFEMSGGCSRCLTPITREHRHTFEHTVPDGSAHTENRADASTEPDLEREDDLAPDGQLDVDELVTSDLLLDFSEIMLCDESCRGLCPKCGKNLNEGDCNCDLSEPDPRFQVLRDLLNEK